MNSAHGLHSANWRKSSYSNADGGDCVEVADGVPGVVPVRDSKTPVGPVLLISTAAWAPFIRESARWRKSSYSNAEGGDCVEVADGLPGIVPVRDSKTPVGPVLLVSTAAWTQFIQGAARS